ncbi:hypothetical protein Rhe02_55720 [Rhizocola hellebori]|uniref:Uncharacterized protein n=1 Tax=Rhizocola hellebori TaxID=1392758 RepID=A0A8J3QD88_9ACTN|nr:hypothetical protein [Rhizocola hellebori]GIH07505.1 hypothetical protein Rhe02_55720 [Rhizocola hellebori]
MADDSDAPVVFGWDASDFDWERGARPDNVFAAAREGIRFFTHKITESAGVVHYRAGEMVRAAVAAGIPIVGFYVVPRTPGPSIAAQVDFAIYQADRQMPEWRTLQGFFWQVDLEHWSYDQVHPQHGVAMAELLRAKTGKRAILYAPRWSYGNSIPGDDVLWASNYGSDPYIHFLEAYAAGGGDNHPGWAPYSGRSPVILQFGSRTTIGGQRICDANAFRGTLDQLRALITGDDEMSWDEQLERVEGETLPTGKVLPAEQRTARTALAFALRHSYSGRQASEETLRLTRQLLASQAESATRESSMLAAIRALAEGGGVEVAPIVDAVRAEAQATRDLVEQRHQSEMAELTRLHAEELATTVAGLQAQLDALRTTD